MFIVFAVLLIIGFGFFGCVDNTQATQQKQRGLVETLSPNNFHLNSNDDIKDYPPGQCIAMICKDKIPVFPLNLFFDRSLKNKQCDFQQINEEDYGKFVTENYIGEKSIKYFMFGAGHSFLSFSDANAYCDNSMKMSVKWLIGGKGFKYSLPEKDRAECFLDINILPVYILYSDFENADAARAGEIAKTLNGAGPAMIVSEAELDDSDVNRYAIIKNQIAQMKTNCPKCLIALGVKLNGTSEYNAINKLFSDRTLFDNVDVVAYGINSHYFNDCNPDKLIYYGISFSNFLLHKYSKPSIISYALFDAAPSLDSSCVWSDVSVANGYSLLYVNANNLASNGVIGAAIYSFYGGGPLKYDNSRNYAFIDINSLATNPQNPSKMEPRFSNYFGFCQAYHTHGAGDAPNIIPLVFSTGSQNCNYAFNTNFGRFVGGSDKEIKPIDIDTYKTTAAQPFSFCAGCVKGEKVPDSIKAFPGSLDKCTSFSPIIEIAADKFDMDPTLLRAAAWQESDFHECSVSEVPIENKNCNEYELKQISDSETNCGYKVQQEQDKICAYGLIQVIEYPWWVYKKYSVKPQDLPDVVKVCASKINEHDYPDFNPFRPYDSACAYAYKFMNDNLPTARRLVDSNLDKLDINVEKNPNDKNKKEWVSIFLALYGIYGEGSNVQQDWIDMFAIQKDIAFAPSSCSYNKDFFDYVKNCLRDYGYDVLAKYKWLANADNCKNTKCAEEKMVDETIIKYLCDAGEMEVNCCNAAKTGLFSLWGQYSAKKLCDSPPFGCEKYCLET